MKTGITRRQFIKTASAAIAALTVDGASLAALASKAGPKKDLPIVVIGGGLGGLSAAAILARQGFPVTLVEQHDRPGGYATSFERDAGRFDFEVSLHATSTSKGGPMKEVFEAAGILETIPMVAPLELARIVTPDHRFVWPQKDPQAVRQSVIKAFPDQEKGIDCFFDKMMGIMDEAMKPFDQDSWFDRLLFPLTHADMWGVRKQTLGDVLDKCLTDPKARTVLSSYWVYFGLPPSKLSSFIYLIATAAYIRYGAYYPKGRSQDISSGLMAGIENNGGNVLLETEATAIIHKEGKVDGVALSGGEILPAKAVVSNANLPETVNMWRRGGAKTACDSRCDKYIRRVNTTRPSISSFIVWLGLNTEIRQKVPGYEYFVEQGYDTEESYRASSAGDPDKAAYTVTFYDNAYDGYSEPGTSTVQILMLSGYAPWKRFENDYFAGRKDAYRREKARIARTLIKKAEESVLPGLSSMIAVMDAATPLTNVRYTGNPQGAIYGFEQTVGNTYMNQIGNVTPLPGLYVSSAWSSGGGYMPTIVSGLSTATRLLKDFGYKKS